ncbi:AraC family transcriptional regulator [Salinisphaera sp. C84B14]|uniref:helix-turn-helix transcriptional regulator n=1 Tax=Salinisphaera sp. C84B14 TaxID=1304155 RepID=UPI0033425F1B
MSLHSNTATDPARLERFIGAAELNRHAAHLGRDYQTRVADDSPPLEGQFGVDALPGGLVLRHASVRNRQDMRSRLQLCPGLKLILVLAGEVDVRFGDRPLPAGAGTRYACAVHLHEPTIFERRARRNSREQSLTLTVPHDWLRQRLVTLGDGRGSMHLLDTPHLCMQPWQPSSALCASAQVLIAADSSGDSAGPARRLRCESLALAMVAEALPALLAMPATDEPPRPIDARRLRRMRDLVDKPSAAPLTVDALAREAGMSRSSLQRHFNVCYGMSVQKFLRERRLQAADRALREDGVNVVTAAELAGYTSAANFATAYRRVYGIAPSERRRRA